MKFYFLFKVGLRTAIEYLFHMDFDRLKFFYLARSELASFRIEMTILTLLLSCEQRFFCFDAH